MVDDIWHYPRESLALHVVQMFETGLSSALTFFAPRRMGKTEFLLKDIQPLAEKKRISTFYFSFLDVRKNAQEEFTNALSIFIGKPFGFIDKIKKVSGEAAGIKAGIELKDDQVREEMKSLLKSLTKKGKVLLLLDEVQVLIKDETSDTFVAALRTALDMHKDHIKVIFTGSSREGLRRMFSQANAPFFHFGQNLPFPHLGREFTEHLANLFHEITKREIDRNQLWQIFQELEQVPQLIRSLIERFALYPNISMNEAKIQLLNDLFNDRAFPESWSESSALERLLLIHIAKEEGALFSQKTQNLLAENLGIKNLSIPSIQSAIRSLQHKSFIGREIDRGKYFIEDPNFKSWLLLEKN